jgi:hypothetical protein
LLDEKSQPRRTKNRWAHQALPVSGSVKVATLFTVVIKRQGRGTGTTERWRARPSPSPVSVAGCSTSQATGASLTGNAIEPGKSQAERPTNLRPQNRRAIWLALRFCSFYLEAPPLEMSQRRRVKNQWMNRQLPESRRTVAGGSFIPCRV